MAICQISESGVRPGQNGGAIAAWHGLGCRPPKKPGNNKCTYIRISVLFVCIYVHIYIYIYIYIYVHTYIYIYIYVSIYIYVYLYIYMYIYVYIYTHTYTYTYIHTYIYNYLYMSKSICKQLKSMGIQIREDQNMGLSSGVFPRLPEDTGCDTHPLGFAEYDQSISGYHGVKLICYSPNMLSTR